MRVRAFDALFVESIQEDALHGLFVAKVVEHLVDEQLPLAVRVACVHDLVGLFDEIFHDAELLRAVLRDVEPPLLRDDGEVLGAPPLVPRIVLIGLRLSQDMAEQPRHDAVPRRQIPVMPLHGAAQTLRNLAPHARLLGDIQTQKHPPLSFHPVLDSEPWNPFKFTHVVRDEHEMTHERLRRNLHIIRPDQAAASFEIRADMAERLRVRIIKRQRRKVRAKHFHRLAVAFRRPALRCAIFKLGNANG